MSGHLEPWVKLRPRSASFQRAFSLVEHRFPSLRPHASKPPAASLLRSPAASLRWLSPKREHQLTRRSSRRRSRCHFAHGLPSPASFVADDPLDGRRLCRNLHEAQLACTVHAHENLHREHPPQEPWRNTIKVCRVGRVASVFSRSSCSATSATPHAGRPKNAACLVSTTPPVSSFHLPQAVLHRCA